jgi:hypothetical protein
MIIQNEGTAVQTFRHYGPATGRSQMLPAIATPLRISREEFFPSPPISRTIALNQYFQPQRFALRELSRAVFTASAAS